MNHVNDIFWKKIFKRSILFSNVKIAKTNFGSDINDIICVTDWVTKKVNIILVT